VVTGERNEGRRLAGDSVAVAERRR
jgi:hypothetical protein